MAEIDIPEELAAALGANMTAGEIFDGMAPSHRRRYAEHVAEAANPETRRRRALKMIELIVGTAP